MVDASELKQRADKFHSEKALGERLTQELRKAQSTLEKSASVGCYYTTLHNFPADLIKKLSEALQLNNYLVEIVWHMGHRDLKVSFE